MIVFSYLNLLIFLLIAVLHFYWALGGRWGILQAIPQLETGESVSIPGPIPTFIVAIGGGGFAMVHAITLRLLLPNLMEYTSYGLVGIAVIFGLRAVGEFKYVGFFKKVKVGNFAENDTRYYTPLCLFISANAILTYIML